MAYKKWKNADGQEIVPPSGAEVVYTLYQDGRRMSKTVTLDGVVDENEPDPWVATFEGLEKYKVDGTEHVYTIKETTGYTGYAAVDENGNSNDTVESGGTIYNKQARELIVTKVWKDAQGNVIAAEDPNFPADATATIVLTEEGTDTSYTITLDGRVDVHGETEPWVATFTNLKSDATYNVSESECAPENYSFENVESVSGETDSYIVSNKKDKTSISVSKVWHDTVNNAVPWPEGVDSVELTLKQKIGTGNPTTIGVYNLTSSGVTKTSGNYDATFDTVPVSGSTALYYRATVSELPLKSGDDVCQYWFEETNSGGYKKSYAFVNDGSITTKPAGENDDKAFDGEYIINTPDTAYELPSTGGSGTTFLTILGSILIFSAGLLLLLRRRRLITQPYSPRRGGDAPL